MKAKYNNLEMVLHVARKLGNLLEKIAAGNFTSQIRFSTSRSFKETQC